MFLLSNTGQKWNQWFGFARRFPSDSVILQKITTNP